jgi:hypothetical protein
MCSYCNYGIASMKVCCDCRVLVCFLVYEIILLFVVLVELLGLVYASFFIKVLLFILSL